MKNNKYKITCIFTLIFVFFCLIINVYAESRYIVLLSNVNIRKGPGTNYTTFKTGSVGSTFNLTNFDIIPDEGKNGDCDDGWYEIDYNGEKAYVCSSYARVDKKESDGNATSVCEKEMQATGFPSSYWKDLCSLKEKHPTWNFKALQTNLEWTTVVEKESACGKNTILTSNSSYIDSSCSYHDGSYKAASQTAVAFYMDPRNFLQDKYIFQFEYLKYDKTLSSSYVSAVSSMFGSAAFYTYHKSLGNDLPKIVNEAGSASDVSPLHIASRMYQELGTSTTLKNLYGGVYTGHDNLYYGYYNFFNIGVNASCLNDKGSTYCGLSYAKSKGWNSVYNAIKGGADFLSSGYISKGQYSSYLQKYNVAPLDISKLYINQYMTNVAAPSSEAISTYNAYKKLGLLESSFVFYIPVYTNMNASISNSSNGAVDSGSSTSPSSSEIPTIVTSAGYKISNGYITGIQGNSKAVSIKNSLEAISGNGTVTIKNSSDKNISDELIGTGCKITIKNDKEEKTYTVAVKGDTSGDGLINAKDLLQIQKSILGTYKLSGAYSFAGDTSNDNTVNAKDLLQVQKSILGTYKIS